MKKAFSLIEVLIVISILAILSTLFLGANTRQVQILDGFYKFSKLKGFLEKFYDRNLTSPYVDEKKYQNFVVLLQSGKNFFLYGPDLSFSGKKDFEATVSYISGNGKNFDRVGLFFIPYDFGCKFFIFKKNNPALINVSSGNLEFFTGKLEIGFGFPKLTKKYILRLNSENCEF